MRESHHDTNVRVARRSGTARVVLPAKVAWDLDLFTKSLRDLAEKIGHSNCLSGLDITFLEQRDWIVNPEGRVEAAGGGAFGG